MRGIRAQCGLDARKKLGLHRWLSTARQRTIKNWMSQQVYQLSRQTYIQSNPASAESNIKKYRNIDDRLLCHTPTFCLSSLDENSLPRTVITPSAYPRSMAKRISKAIDTSVSQTHQHETLEDNNSIAHQEPPPYSSPVAARPSPSGNQQRSIRCLSNIPSLPNLDYSKYQIPECTVSKDGTITTNYRPLCSDATALAQFIREQAALPPLPYIRIVGLPPGASQPDFDVRINMLRYFLPTSSSTGWNYLKLVEDGQLAFRGKNTQTTTPNTKNGIEDWAKRFCAEKSSLKTYGSAPLPFS